MAVKHPALLPPARSSLRRLQPPPIDIVHSNLTSIQPVHSAPTLGQRYSQARPIQASQPSTKRPSSRLLAAEPTVIQVSNVTTEVRLLCPLEVGGSLRWTRNGKQLPFDADRMYLYLDELILYRPEPEADRGLYECNGRRYTLRFAGDRRSDDWRLQQLQQRLIRWASFAFGLVLGTLLALLLLALIVQRILRRSIGECRKLVLAMRPEDSLDVILHRMRDQRPDERLEQVVEFAFMALVK